MKCSLFMPPMFRIKFVKCKISCLHYTFCNKYFITTFSCHYIYQISADISDIGIFLLPQQYGHWPQKPRITRVLLHKVTPETFQTNYYLSNLNKILKLRPLIHFTVRIHIRHKLKCRFTRLSSQLNRQKLHDLKTSMLLVL